MALVAVSLPAPSWTITTRITSFSSLSALKSPMFGKIRRVAGTLRHTAGRARDRIGRKGLILLYHRIASDEIDPYRLCVSPHRFEAHLQMLQDIGRVVRLSEMAESVREGRITDRSIAVTFDDGYQDNYYTAKPLLEKYGVPATVFMTTGSIGRDREFWWDELERIFLRPGQVPPQLELELDGARHSWTFETTSVFSREESRRYRQWTFLDDETPTERHAALRDLHALLQGLPSDRRMHMVDTLLDWAQAGRYVRSTHRALDAEEVREMAKDGLIEIGGHTVSHPALPAQEIGVQREEIARSKATLEEWLGRPIIGFAYPYGYHAAETVAEVKAAGFEYACACGSLAVVARSDMHRLPRVDVGDWSDDAFERVVSRYLKRW